MRPRDSDNAPNLLCPKSRMCDFGMLDYLERHSFDFVTDGDVNFLAMEVCADSRLVYLWSLLLDISMQNISPKKERGEGVPIRLMNCQHTAE